MSCGCKSGGNQYNNDVNQLPLTNSNIFLRVLFFLISFGLVIILTIPLILPFIGYMLFNSLVLKKSTNLTKPLFNIGKIIKKTSSKGFTENDDNDYEDLEDINPDDYELMDVDVIEK